MENLRRFPTFQHIKQTTSYLLIYLETKRVYCPDKPSHLNGANVADICNLKFENIKRGNIEFYRQKTLAKSKVKKAVAAYITPEMQVIMNSWGNKTVSPTHYIFPILTGKESSLEKRAIIKSATRSINHYMTKIGKNIGVGNISTYTARHSFATVLKRSGSNIAFISESLGQSLIFQIFYFWCLA